MGAVSRQFDKPDETRDMEHGRGDVVHLESATAARATFEPGWRWSTSVKPVVGGDSCQAHHVGYALTGTLHVVTEDGTEIDLSAGDAYEIMPGHDAWVVGDEPWQGLEFQSETAESYGKS